MRGLRVVAGSDSGDFLLDLRERRRDGEAARQREAERGSGSWLHCCVQFVLQGRQELVSPGGPRAAGC
ncbi:hypothetical protein SRHO_G00031740 [Serrasalmus rhombeus]